MVLRISYQILLVCRGRSLSVGRNGLPRNRRESPEDVHSGLLLKGQRVYGGECGVGEELQVQPGGGRNCKVA